MKPKYNLINYVLLFFILISLTTISTTVSLKIIELIGLSLICTILYFISYKILLHLSIKESDSRVLIDSYLKDFKLQDFEVIVDQSKCVLELIDIEGKLAKYNKSKTIIAVNDDVKQFIERGLWFDGSADGFSFSDNIKYEINSISGKRNYVDLALTFNEPMSKNDRKIIEMSWIIKDSFINNTEFFTTIFELPIRDYSLDIVFPNNRPVVSAWVEFTYMGHKIKHPNMNLLIDENNLKVSFKTQYAKPGMKSTLFWEW